MDKRVCDSKHSACKAHADYILSKKTEEITFEETEKFISITTSYNGYCLNRYQNNTYYNKIIECYIKISEIRELKPVIFIYLGLNLEDTILERILRNNLKYDENYCTKLLNERNGRGYHGNNLSFFNIITGGKIKMMTLLFEKISFDNFISNINSFRVLGGEYDNIILKFLEKSINEKEKVNLNQKSLLDYLFYKINIFEKIITKMNKSIDFKLKKELLERVCLKCNKNLIMKILNFEIEQKKDDEELITETTINNLCNSSYVRDLLGSPNNNVISEVIDIMIDYGLKINDEMIIKLLEKGCYINKIERFEVKNKEEIMEKMATINYYPYSFDLKPSYKVMLIESGKHNNLERIKILKEKGGILDLECLKKACSIKRNGKLIKFLINECGIKPNIDCINIFQETNYIEGLDIMVKNYKDKDDKMDTIDKKEVEKRSVEIDDNSTMRIIRREDIEIEFDKEYTIRGKIRKLMNYKKEIITYRNLNKIVLQYLIDKKLVIGNYFILNHELSQTLKLNLGTLIHIDELQNILPYFIENIS